MSALAELEKTLAALFTPPELERWLVGATDDGWRVRQALPPSATTPPASWFFEATQAVARFGLVDAAFFMALTEERPQRAAEIAQTEALWLAHPPAGLELDDHPARRLEGEERLTLTLDGLFATLEPELLDAIERVLQRICEAFGLVYVRRAVQGSVQVVLGVDPGAGRELQRQVGAGVLTSVLGLAVKGLSSAPPRLPSPGWVRWLAGNAVALGSGVVAAGAVATTVVVLATAPTPVGPGPDVSGLEAALASAEGRAERCEAAVSGVRATLSETRERLAAAEAALEEGTTRAPMSTSGCGGCEARVDKAEDALTRCRADLVKMREAAAAASSDQAAAERALAAEEKTSSTLSGRLDACVKKLAACR